MCSSSTVRRRSSFGTRVSYGCPVSTNASTVPAMRRVLDVKVRGDRVHLLTHTTEPLTTPERGVLEYGCTEFVFQAPSSPLKGGNAEPLFQLIESWLEWSPDQRMCAPGNPQLCLEP